MSNQLELLLPAGDPEKLKFALAYGADAVYAGVPIFSLRARENGFDKESIREAIGYTQSLDKKIYLTMNIFAHNSRVDRFLDSFCETQDLQPDGFIMSDVGLIHKALKLRPNAIIHLSTQANATNWTAVEFWRDLGVKRIVLSRELSLKEIAKIHHKVPEIELEVFVHGSICIAYSGRCLISNYINFRNANEGTCTNSCRWQYSLAVKYNSLKLFEESHLTPESTYEPLGNSYYIKEGGRPDQHFELDEDEHGTYMMNSKDLCAIELLRELRDSGVVSFKVEGRAKGLYYVASIARAYRGAIDDLNNDLPFNQLHLSEALSAANRTLMTGFLLRKPQEYGQNYTDGASLPATHEYVGKVVEVDRPSGRALVNVKNKLTIGDVVEWISPKNTVRARVENIQLLQGSSRSSISGGSDGWINCPGETTIFSLLRKPLQDQPEEIKRLSARSVLF